jgi:excisionase family DNA binding protein
MAEKRTPNPGSQGVAEAARGAPDASLSPESTLVTKSETTGQQPALVDADDVAKTLNCSRRTVRRLADSGRMPAPIRLGRLLRWDRRALLEWIAAGCPSCRSGRSR